MKTLRTIGMALLAIVMCINFTACEQEEEPWEPADAIDCEFYGTNPEGYGVSIYIETETKCLVSIYSPNSTSLVDCELCDYQYNKETFTFTCTYNGNLMTGKLRAEDGVEYMDITDHSGTYTLAMDMEDVDVAPTPQTPLSRYYGSVWTSVIESENLRRELHVFGSYVILKFYELNSNSPYPTNIRRYRVAESYEGHYEDYYNSNKFELKDPDFGATLVGEITDDGNTMTLKNNTETPLVLTREK